MISLAERAIRSDHGKNKGVILVPSALAERLVARGQRQTAIFFLNQTNMHTGFFDISLRLVVGCQ